MKKVHSILGFYVFAISCFTFSVVAQDRSVPIDDPDRFPAVSFKVEKKRLTEAVKLWQLDQRKNIYLIVYSKISGKQSDATKRLMMSKNYLKRTHKVPLDKIKTVYGGTLPDLEMVIFVTSELPESSVQ